MNPPESPVTLSLKPATAAETRLHGRWLWAARGIWVALVALTLVMYVAALPVAFNVTRTICRAQPCVFASQPGPEAARALQERYGISLDALAWFYTVSVSAYMIFYLAVALLIFWRRSDDWLALVVSLMLVTLGFTVSSATPYLAQVQPIWLWPSRLIGLTGIVLFIVLFYLFPDGRFIPRWTRWLAALWFGMYTVIFTVATASQMPLNLTPIVFISPSLAGMATVVVAQVYRYRRVSTASQRQQTKWVVFGLAGMFVPTAIALAPGIAASALNLMAWGSLPFILYLMFQTTLASVFLPFLPVGFALSIFRYRLWDVDFVINRGLVYGGLTVLLGAVFVGGFFGLQAVLQALLGSGQVMVAVAIPAIVITALFNPARRWLRAFVDRRIYGIRVDYQKADTPTPSPVASSGMLRTQLGAYENLEPIGRGGMAEIYQARHPTLDKTVAIKVLPPALARHSDFRRRFEREAKVVAALKHPNIVQVFDFGESDGTYYMVMEFVAGRDLGDIIHEAAPLPPERARAIIEDIAGALDYAHGQGLVHRDVKPSNVMVEPVTSTSSIGSPSPSAEGAAGRGRWGVRFERAVLMDFGIARILTGGTRLTATGTMGTFDYIAPEQIQAVSDVDGRADVYSLGVMAFQMLAGRLPFDAAHPAALLIAHLNQPPPDPRQLNPHLPEGAAVALLRALAKKPNQRFNTAGELAAALL